MYSQHIVQRRYVSYFSSCRRRAEGESQSANRTEKATATLRRSARAGRRSPVAARPGRPWRVVGGVRVSECRPDASLKTPGGGLVTMTVIATLLV